VCKKRCFCVFGVFGTTFYFNKNWKSMYLLTNAKQNENTKDKVVSFIVCSGTSALGCCSLFLAGFYILLGSILSLSLSLSLSSSVVPLFSSSSSCRVPICITIGCCRARKKEEEEEEEFDKNELAVGSVE
jgi:hypothetical protein